MGLLGLYTTDEYGQEDFSTFERSGSVEYLAAFTSDCDYNYVRENLGLIPFEVHPTDSGQRLISFSNKRLDTSPTPFTDPTSGATSNTPCSWWQCILQFGAVNPREISLTGNPTDQPFGLSFVWETFEEAVDTAIIGKNTDGTYQYAACVNSCGDLYDPPITRDQLRGIIGVEYNALNYNPAVDFGCGVMINSTVWNGFGPHTVKYTPPNMPAKLFSQFLGQDYYRLNAQYQFNPYGWDAVVIDAGYNYSPDGVNKLKILDYQGMPLDKPSLLNGSGGIEPIGSGNYHTRTYQVYPDVDFNAVFPALANLFTPIYF